VSSVLGDMSKSQYKLFACAEHSSVLYVYSLCVCHCATHVVLQHPRGALVQHVLLTTGYVTLQHMYASVLLLARPQLATPTVSGQQAE
jgi:hypothetical protein